MNNKRLILFALVLTIGFLSVSCDGSSSESGETILEPIQPNIVAGLPTHAIGSSSEQKLAQTFTINTNGMLTGIFLPLHCTSGELTIEIRDVAGTQPGTTVISSQTFDADSLVTGVTVFKLFNASPLEVTRGDQLAFVLSNATGSCGISSAPIGDTYSGGEAFFDSRPNPPGWIPFSENDSISHDLAFQVLIEGV